MSKAARVAPRLNEAALLSDQGDSSQAKAKLDGAHWCRLLVPRERSRQVCRFWLEKALILIDGLQIYALIWQLSQPWPWPARWLRWTRWINASNLDLLAFRATGAGMGATSRPFSLWGDMEWYTLYAMAWALVPHCTLAAFITVKRLWKQSGRRDYLLRGFKLENVLLQAFQVLYLPVGLAVLRIVNCDYDGTVSVDPTVLGTCWSSSHVASICLIVCALGGVFLLGFPWMLNNIIVTHVIHSDAEKHEQFLMSKELEFLLGTSDTYLELNMPVYSSFHRHSIRAPVENCLMKLLLLLSFSLLRSPAPKTTNQGSQGTIFFFVIVVRALRHALKYPYRELSSSLFAQIVDWMLVANCIFGTHRNRCL